MLSHISQTLKDCPRRCFCSGMEWSGVSGVGWSCHKFCQQIRFRMGTPWQRTCALASIIDAQRSNISHPVLSSKSPKSIVWDKCLWQKVRNKVLFSICKRLERRTGQGQPHKPLGHVAHYPFASIPSLWGWGWGWGKTFSIPRSSSQFFSHFSYCRWPWAIHLGPQNTKSS